MPIFNLPRQDAGVKESVERYRQRGWLVLPVERAGKRPAKALGRNWQEKARDVKLVDSIFQSGNYGVGVVLGEPSCGLVDIDLDDPLAVQLAAHFLPPTGAVFGRRSKPRSHWLYVSPGARTARWQYGGDTLVELRGTGSQTVFPPSVHPSGEAVAWAVEGDPAAVSKDELEEACSKLAAAALLAKHWPAGARQDAALALAGGLLRAGWGEDDVKHFLRVVAEAAGDEEVDKRLEAIGYTAQKLQAGEAVTGWPRLGEVIGDEVARKVVAWLGIPQSGGGEGLAGTSYMIQNGCLYWRKPTRDGEVTVPLCNFTAKVTRDVVLDDGAGEARIFEVEGTLSGGKPLPRIRVPAEKFFGMNWTALWGVDAVVSAGHGAKDRLREAIQLASRGAPQERVFVHLGWREAGGRWVYLHAGGAVGGDRVTVQPESEALRRYALPDGGDTAEGLKTSLALLDIAPPEAVLPLWASVWRAPTASLLYPTVVLWLHGPTGSFKSTLAALFLAHFGAFTKDNLPGSWLSTDNALERLCFLARDALVVVDDYAPEQHPREAAVLDRRVNRLVRQVGNRAARGRLDGNLRARPETPPNALVISTGEQLPLGIASVAARILPVLCEREKVSLEALTRCQAQAHLLPAAMRGYVGWLAPQINKLAQELPRRFEELRAQATVEGHARLPEAVAHLHLGAELGVSYAKAAGVLDEERAQEILDLSWRVLLELAAKHARTMQEERPTVRFLQALNTIFFQGKGYLADRRTGGAPPGCAQDFGWRRAGDAGLYWQGELLGWVDKTFVYLVPQAAWRAVCQYLGDFGLRERALKEALVREGISLPDTGRLDTTVWAGGRAHRVLKIEKKHLLLLNKTGESGEEAVPSQ